MIIAVKTVKLANKVQSGIFFPHHETDILLETSFPSVRSIVTLRIA